jgi:hypothetical protein
MAKQNSPQIVARKESVTTITDVHGQVIVEIGQREYTVRQSDGSLIHRSLNQHMITVCGASWAPAMQCAKPPLHIGICRQCREGISLLSWNKTHGVCLLCRSKLCVDCGTLCCPSHRKLGRDRRWRCLKHYKRHLLGSIVKPLFFERTD